MVSFPAQYLIRFDDLCPTMHHENWRQAEALMDRYDIRPIVAIVPDNRDRELQVCPHDRGFWERMRRLQARGWTIGIHGYQHVCTAAGRSLVPLHRWTEFAGQPLEVQRQMLRAGMDLLHKEGLKPSVWVAPRHGFDDNTLLALRSAGIGILSDGLGLLPWERGDVFWIPQQLWEMKKKWFGVWTVCLHPNRLSPDAFHQLENFLRCHSRQFTTVPDVQQAHRGRRRGVADIVHEFVQLARIAAARHSKAAPPS